MKVEEKTTEMGVKYWVGDLCYVMHDAWKEVCDQTPFDNSEHDFELQDGRQYFLFSTAYGDGEYYDDDGNRYPVDSGTIGAIRLENILDPQANLALGAIHEFPVELDHSDCYEESGVLHFLNVAIDTIQCDDDEYYYGADYDDIDYDDYNEYDELDEDDDTDA